jgi:hypothetical protein
MRRQTPHSLPSRPALPTYPTRPPSEPRPPRALSGLCLVGLAALSSGCWSFWPGSSDGVGFRSEHALTAVGQPVTLTTSERTTCRPDWSVAVLPSGAASRGASVRGDGSTASFTAHEPGEYEITARCGDASHKQRITAFAPSATLSAAEPAKLPFACQDAMAGPRGRILCVDRGVHIVDPETGAELGRTAEPGPQTWGIDVEGERFVSVTLGCTAGRDDCPSPGVKSGMYLYQLGADDKPVLLSHLDKSAELAPLLDGNRLFISSDYSLQRYSLQDPTKATEVGCISDKELGLVPVPFFIDGKLGVLSWNNTLLVHDADKVTPDCATPTPPLARLALDPDSKSAIFYTRPAVNGSLVYAASSVALTTIDLSEPLRPSISAKLGISTGSAVIHRGRLIVLGDQSVVALDLLDPRHPRPVAQLRLPSGTFGEAGTFDRVVAIGDKLWLARSKTLRRLEIK